MNAIELRATVLLCSIFALRVLGLFMIIPLFAIYGQQYQYATPALIGLAVGAYGLTQALFQIPLSLMADRFPRKPIIAIALLVFAVGCFVSGSSDTIYGVIIGRAIAGMGALSAVAMALLSDVVREEKRNMAMAAMGMAMAMSFNVAFAIGPILGHKFGISGLFYLTSIAAVVAACLLWYVPKPERLLKLYTGSYTTQLKRVIRMPQLNYLHASIFSIHFIVTAVFMVLPKQLIDVLHLPINHHGWLYLPMMLVGFVCAVPAIIIAEKKKKMRSIFLAMVACILLAMVLLGFSSTTQVGLCLGLFAFILPFSVIEALLPSWLAKVAPIVDKSTAMGINSTCQFLGAGLGGITAGWMLQHQLSVSDMWWWLAGFALVWGGQLLGC